MMQKAPLSKQQSQETIKRINAQEAYYDFTFGHDLLDGFTVSFYDQNTWLYQLTPAGSHSSFDALYYIETDAGALICLDGQIATIHHINLICHITLSGENVFDYLKYYLFFTALERGQQYAEPQFIRCATVPESKEIIVKYKTDQIKQAKISHQGQVTMV